MKDIKKLVRELIKENRLTMMIGILVYSVISVLISTIFQSFNLLVIGFIPTTILSFIYMIQMFSFSDDVVNGKRASLKDLFRSIKVRKQHRVIALVYVAWALLSFVLLFVLGRVPALAPVAIILLLLMYVFSNAVNNTFYFMKSDNVKKDYLRSVQVVLKDKKLLFSSLFKTLTIVIQGSLLVILINVFAFAPQLDLILDKSNTESTILIQQIFANNISTFIQTVGVQAIMYYILFVSCITYGTYVRKNKI